jgi:hypothetical protein
VEAKTYESVEELIKERRKRGNGSKIIRFDELLQIESKKVTKQPIKRNLRNVLRELKKKTEIKGISFKKPEPISLMEKTIIEETKIKIVS